MSDTPIDRDLSEKASTRWPAYLRERIDEFREQYNERLRESGLSEDAREQFILDSKSDARRRLVDLGLAVADDDSLPFGFEFDFEGWGDEFSDPVCPGCGAYGGDSFRVGAALPADADGVLRFEKVECQSCGHRTHISDVVQSQRLF